MGFDLVTTGVVCADVMVRPVDTLPERGKMRLVPQLELHLGGLAAVTAAIFAQLGGRAAVVGKVGEDGFGAYIASRLAHHGVDVSHLERTAEYHTAATVVVISEDGERTFLHHTGASAVLTDASIQDSILGEARIFHWGGPSVTPGLDGEPIARVLARARQKGAKTSMDTCFDGKGIWFPLIEHALPHLDIVMSSLPEAQHYTGQETPPAIAEFYRSFGVETVMVKLGADGVYVENGHEAHLIPAHEVNVVDTTGAGDAACAGFLHGYLHGWDLVRCGKLANAIGALTVQTMGGSEGVRSLDEALAYVEKV
jgi:sugar/nucleoside kinase (ribokinase family)